MSRPRRPHTAASSVVGPEVAVVPPQNAGANAVSTADLIMLGLIVAMVLTVYRLPLAALSYDDGNVLPERAVMSDNADWLGHLLHFNQTRLTYAGDFALFRPGLFFMYWAADVLARHDRILLNNIAVTLYAVTAAVLYLTLRRWCGVWLALALCMIFVYPNQGYVLANAWHVTGYLLSIVLYVVGFWLLDREILTAGGGWRRAFGPPTLALFLSTLFHEFAAVAMMGTAAFLVVVGNRPSSAVRGVSTAVWSILASVGGYLVLYAVNLMRDPPPEWGSTVAISNVQALASNTLGFLAHAGMFVWPTGVAYAPSLNVLPMGISLPFGTVRAFVAIVALAPIYPSVIAILRSAKAGTFSITEVAFVMALAVLIAAVSLVRVATNSVFHDFYYPMVGFFLVALTARGLSLFFSHTPNRGRSLAQWMLIGSLIAIAIGRGVELSVIHRIRFRQIEPEVSVVSNLAAFFQRNAGLCHAGLELHYQTEGNTPLWYAPRWILTDRLPSLSNMETELQYFNCGIRHGRPVYTLIVADHDLTRINLIFREFDVSRARSMLMAIVRGDLGVEPFNQGRGANRFEAANHMRVDNHLHVVARTQTPVQLNGIRVSFRTPRERRILYHFGVRVRAAHLGENALSTSVFFVDTMVRSLNSMTRPGQDGDSWARWIPMLPAQGSVVFRRDGPDCLVFLDEYLLGVLSDCPGQPVYVEFLEWSNGTPDDVLESIASEQAPSRLRWRIIAEQKLILR